jgi:hypothetical protein
LLDLLLLLLKRHHRATTRRLGFRHEEEENAMRMKELWSLAYQQSRRRMLLGWREREREIHSCSQSEAAAAALPPPHLLSCFFSRRHDAHADESENQPR